MLTLFSRGWNLYHNPSYAKPIASRATCKKWLVSLNNLHDTTLTQSYNRIARSVMLTKVVFSVDCVLLRASTTQNQSRQFEARARVR